MPLIWLIVGYLVGSVSGARVIGRGVDLSGVSVVVGGTGETAPLEGVSSSALLAKRGPSAGLTAAGIDVVKAALATAGALAIDSRDAAVWCALGVGIGHIFPIWHGFRGGFGATTLIGSLLVLDPIGLGAALLAGAILGLVVGSAFAMTELWVVFLTPWAVWQNRSLPLIIFIFTATLLYVWRSRQEASVAWSAWRSDQRRWWARVKDVTNYPDYRAGE